MKGRDAAAAFSLLSVVLGATACRGAGGQGLAVTFDVQQLPPAPPETPASESGSPPADNPAVSQPVQSTAESEPDARGIEGRLARMNGDLKPVYFDTGRWDVSDDGRRAIEADARLLLAAGDFQGTVEGHADERGSESYNYVLGIWRAKAVKDQLRDLGVAPSRLTIVSHGKKSPASKGSDRESLSRNRRVEIVIRSAP